MTGYGRAVQTFENREITVEIRSVNNRYLDCSVKLPRVFGFAEDSVKAKVKEEISRGKVDVFIGVNVTAGSDMKISLNRPVLEGYLSAMKTIAADYEVKDDISVSSLTRFSDIFVVEKQEEDEQQATQEILTVVSQALEKYAPCMTAIQGAFFIITKNSQSVRRGRRVFRPMRILNSPRIYTFQVDFSASGQSRLPLRAQKSSHLRKKMGVCFLRFSFRSSAAQNSGRRPPCTKPALLPRTRR